MRRFVRDCLSSWGARPEQVLAPAHGPKNLVAWLPPPTGAPRRPLLFSAHLDVLRTVPPAAVASDGERLVARDGSPLGADDRAGCALLLGVARRALAGGLRHPGLVLVFTAEEERGLLGAWRAPLPGRPCAGFVLDYEGPAGCFAWAGPGVDRTELATRRRLRAPAYRLPPHSLPRRLLARAARRAGIALSPGVARALSDAHVWNARGIPSVNLGIGVERPHQPAEALHLGEFARAFRLVLALVEEAALP